MLWMAGLVADRPDDGWTPGSVVRATSRLLLEQLVENERQQLPQSPRKASTYTHSMSEYEVWGS